MPLGVSSERGEKAGRKMLFIGSNHLLHKINSCVDCQHCTHCHWSLGSSREEGVQ